MYVLIFYENACFVVCIVLLMRLTEAIFKKFTFGNIDENDQK